MKAELIKLVTEKRDEAEEFYMNHGPNKREQEEHYDTGVSVVSMNVGLLTGWLSWRRDEIGEDAHTPEEAWEELSKEDRRAVWEASGFHWGMTGYEQHDADFYWQHEA